MIQTQVRARGRQRGDEIQPLSARRTPTVKIWAMLGGLIITFQVAIWAKWITGPRFERVPSGPSSPPEWMKVVLNTWQVTGTIAAVILLYWLVVLPWRRQRTLTIDGLLCLAFISASFQDPMGNYYEHWFTYNSYMVNWGSWVNDIPGWMAHGQPGAMLPEPPFFVVPAWMYGGLLIVFFGCKVMQAVQRRRPATSQLGLIGSCWLAMVVFSVLVEGLIWIPLGFYTYAGGPGAINGDHYFRFPIVEAVMLAGFATAFACLRFFTNDRGQTLVERGLEQYRLSAGRTVLLRLLAVVGFVNAAIFVLYAVPASWVGAHSTSWPADIQKRSYFTDHLCGAGTDRACPGPDVPLSRPRSPYLGPSGELVDPEPAKRPAVVPFEVP